MRAPDGHIAIQVLRSPITRCKLKMHVPIRLADRPRILTTLTCSIAQSPRANRFTLPPHHVSAYLHMNHNTAFDESVHGPGLHNCHEGRRSFSINPPLGTQLLDLGSRIGGYECDQDFDGPTRWPDLSQVRRLRVWPALAGSLCGPLTFVTLRNLGISSLWAFIGAPSLLSTRDSLHRVTSSYPARSYPFFRVVLSYALHCMRHAVAAHLGGARGCGGGAGVTFTGCRLPLTVLIALWTGSDPIRLLFIAGAASLGIFQASFRVHFRALRRRGPGCPCGDPAECQTARGVTLRPTLLHRESDSLVGKWGRSHRSREIARRVAWGRAQHRPVDRPGARGSGRICG
jgi:hypothetical protein